MKTFVLTTLLTTVLASPLGLAQAADASHGTQSPQSSATSKAAPKHRKVSKKTLTKAIETATPTAAPAQTLSSVELEIAKEIYVGQFQCELGAQLTVKQDEHNPGYFQVLTGKRKFYMHPVESRTGATRMEDGLQQVVLLQLGNKSMLMDQKLGQRLADECHSPEQNLVAESLKEHPQASLLEDAPKK